MSYQPTNWVCGDLVTAEKMNKLEQGLADIGGVASLMDVASQVLARY